MAPSWTGRLWFRLAILVLVCGGTVGGVWLASGGFGQEQQGPPPGQIAVPPAVLPAVAKADSAKLPKDASKKAPEAAKPRGEGAERKGESGERKRESRERKEESARPAAKGKAVSLVEAITFAEKSGKGQAVRAERQGKGGKANFTVELLDTDGARTRVRLTATGEILGSEPAPKTGRPREREGREGRERDD